MRKQRYSIKILRRGKNLAFSEKTGLEEERVRSKVNPKENRSGIKTEGEV